MIQAGTAGSRREMRPRSGTSAKALLLTILGEFVLPNGGSAWTSTLISALGACDVGEGNGRQALARLAAEDVLCAQKHGRTARRFLTPDGRQLLTEGTERIYGFGAHKETWDGNWLVLYCSVPEEQRDKRHQLRSQLGFAGFGFLGPGLAVAPELGREPTAYAILDGLGLLPNAVVLRSTTGDLVEDEDILRRAWDLESVASEYREFSASFVRREPTTPEAHFRSLVELVHTWRRFPFIDPEIPRQLLPADWAGDRAKAVFDECHARWSPAANDWYRAREDVDVWHSHTPIDR